MELDRAATTTPTPPIAPQARRAARRDSHDADGPWADEEPAQEVIRVWPHPASYRFDATKGWVPASPWLQVERTLADAADDHEPDEPSDTSRWNPALERQYERIPAEVRAATAIHAWSIQFPVLRLLAALPGLQDLALTNPTLTGLLALKLDEGALEATDIEPLLRGPRRFLLPPVGLPAERSVARILAKTEARTICFPGPLILQRVLLDPRPRVRKWLRHLPAVTYPVVSILADPDLLALATFDLLNDPNPDAVGERLEMLVQARDEGLPMEPPTPFRSLAELQEFTRRTPALLAAPLDVSRYPRPFSVPSDEVVLPGYPSLTLRPARTAIELREHGLRERLCLAHDGRYTDAAAHGQGATYVAEWTQDGELRRATAWLVRADRRWQLEEIALTANEACPAWLRVRLVAWAASLPAGVQ